MIALTRILVPTNLGEPSKAAIRYGVALARQFHAQLFLLHVVRSADYDAAIEAERVLEKLAPDDAQRGEPSQDQVIRTVACADLRQLLDPQEEQDTRAEYLLRPAGSDSPHATIAQCAREMGIELIVIGKHGLGRIEQMLGGSVTEKLVRQAPCPVMIVKHPGHEFVLPDALAQTAEY
jgi:nucleotide-binding universal stress UspA family protein